MNITKKQFLSGIQSKSNVLSLENIIPSKNYTLTISPDPVSEQRITQTYHNLLGILDLFHANIVLYTELSTKNQNVHYHGFINFDKYLDITQFYLNIKEINTLCHFEMDDLTDLDQWYPYIVKQCPHMDAICHSRNIPNKIKYSYHNIHNNNIIKKNRSCHAF